MQIQFNAINKILMDSDVEGFIEIGAPNDEYESEAKVITDALNQLEPSQVTEEQILAIINLVWMKYFNLGPDELKLRRDHLQNVARDILLQFNS